MNKSTLTGRTIKGILWVFMGTMAQALIQIISMVVLSRLVLPKEFGLVNAALIVIGFSTLFSQIGIGPAIVQRKELAENHIRTGFTVSLVLGFLLMLLTVLIAPAIADFMRMDDLTPVLRVTAPLFLVQALFVIPNSILSRNMRFRIQAIVQIISYGLGYGLLGIILAYFKWGIWALVSAQIAQAIISSILTTLYQPYSKRLLFDWQAFKDLFYFGGGFTIARVGNYFAGNGDNFVVGRWMGEEALGLYSRAFQMMGMPATLFGQVLDTVLFPAMSSVQDSKSRLASAFRRGVFFIAVIVIPISVLSIILAPEVVRLVLGNQWDAAIIPFQILAFSMLFRTSYKMSDSLARATGAVYDRAWRQIIYAAFVISGALFGMRWGLAGVSVGVLLATIANYLLMAQLSLKLIDMSWKNFLNAQLPSFGFAIFSSLITWKIADLMRSYSISSILIILISALVMGMLMLLILWLKPKLLLGQDGVWAVNLFEKSFAAYLPPLTVKFLNRVRQAYE